MVRHNWRGTFWSRLRVSARSATGPTCAVPDRTCNHTVRRSRFGRANGGGKRLRFVPREQTDRTDSTASTMALGRWKTARMVEVYTRSEEAGRAAK